MEARVFEQNLTVEGTSLFLLLESLSDSGMPLVRDEVIRFWNASPQSLDDSFAELAGRDMAEADASGAWHLKPFAEWKREA